MNMNISSLNCSATLYKYIRGSPLVLRRLGGARHDSARIRKREKLARRYLSTPLLQLGGHRSGRHGLSDVVIKNARRAELVTHLFGRLLHESSAA